MNAVFVLNSGVGCAAPCHFSYSPHVAEYALRNLTVWTAYFPVLAQDILGKGGLFVASPLEDCHTGLTGSSTQAEQVVGSSVANCQALT